MNTKNFQTLSKIAFTAFVLLGGTHALVGEEINLEAYTQASVEPTFNSFVFPKIPVPKIPWRDPVIKPIEFPNPIKPIKFPDPFRKR